MKRIVVKSKALVFPVLPSKLFSHSLNRAFLDTASKVQIRVHKFRKNRFERSFRYSPHAHLQIPTTTRRHARQKRLWYILCLDLSFTLSHSHLFQQKQHISSRQPTIHIAHTKEKKKNLEKKHAKSQSSPPTPPLLAYIEEAGEFDKHKHKHTRPPNKPEKQLPREKNRAQCGWCAMGFYRLSNGEMKEVSEAAVSCAPIVCHKIIKNRRCCYSSWRNVTP